MCVLCKVRHPNSVTALSLVHLSHATAGISLKLSSMFSEEMGGKESSRTTSGTGSHRRLNGSVLHGTQSRISIKDEELDKLQDDIKRAYTLKALQAQLLEREARQLAEHIENRVADEVSTYKREVEFEERQRQDQAQRHERAIELKLQLERQLEEKMEARRLLREEEYRERQVLHEVDRVRERDELAEKIRLRRELSEQLSLEQLVQRELREVSEQRLLELEERLAARERFFAEELEARIRRSEQSREEAQQRRERTTGRVAEMLLEVHEAREERNRLLAELMVEEARLEARAEAHEAELLRRRRRQEARLLAEALEEQMRFEDECKRRWLERERRMAEEVMRLVARSERVERLSAEARRRRCAQYREELELLMEQRRQTRQDELEKSKKETQEKLEREQDERLEAKSLRMRLLERHAEHVADFMSARSLYEDERALLDAARVASNSTTYT